MGVNVLIVDDQPLILKVTKNLVDWGKLGVSRVITAESAAEARKIIQHEQIDILLADIEMPEESGISLQKWQRAEYPDISCIFLTSHAEFDYARQAMRSGAFDYILQPATVSDIEQVISRCLRERNAKHIILEQSRGYEKKVRQSVEDGAAAMFFQGDSFPSFSQWRRDAGTEEGNWYYLPAVIYAAGSSAEVMRNALAQELERLDLVKPYIAVSLGEHETGVILMQTEKFGSQAAQQEEGGQIRINLSDMLHVPVSVFAGHIVGEQLPAEAGKLYAFAKQRIGADSEREGSFLTMPGLNPAEPSLPETGKWASWIMNGDVSLLENQIRNLIQCAREDGMLTSRFLEEMKNKFQAACALACYSRKWSEEEIGTGRLDNMQEINVQSFLQQVHEILGVVQSLLTADGAGNELYSVKDKIHEVIDYLNKHMDENVSRREAAKFALLNEDYFSKVFRRETGSGYKEYVLNMKINYAKEMLSETDIPVGLIAAKIGYDNLTNFTQMFRKYTGMTPTQWRKQMSSRPDG